MVHILEIQNGKHRGHKVKLKKARSIIGRGEEAQIRIGSHEVSRKHCLVEIRDDSIWVQDLGSSNGTFVNGSPISNEEQLTPGSTLTVGPMTFQLLGGNKSAKEQLPVAIKQPNIVDDGLSDDDIASWLGEEGDADQDTRTDIPTSQDDTVKIAKPEPPAPKKEFANVAEEAKDIIRRHYEMIEQDDA